MPEGLTFCRNYEFNLLYHVGVVAKRLHAAAAETAHEGDDNTPSGPGVTTIKIYLLPVSDEVFFTCTKLM